MGNNYNILADFIVSKYIDHISGNDIEDTFVEDALETRVMVGMLAENRVDESFSDGYVENQNTRFESVPSITVSFRVQKNDRGVLTIIPRGLLFYSVEPDYQKTVRYILQKYSEKDHCTYVSIRELCDLYPEERFLLPLTYNKVRIEDVLENGIQIRLDSLTDKKFHLEDQIKKQLEELVAGIFDQVCICQSTRISFYDLATEESFNIITSVRDEKALPRWSIDIYCSVVDEGNTLRFFLQMVNKTPIYGKKNIGYLPKIFDAGMKISGNENIHFEEIELDCFKNSYKERSPIYAVTENTSAIFDASKNTIYTDNIPKYYQMRLKTKNDFNQYVTFESLLNDPIGNLMHIHNAMRSDYTKCEEEFRHTRFGSETARIKFQNALNEYQWEINRFRIGIDQIRYKDHVKKAFRYMNQTFQTQLPGEHRKIVGWRLFQIVFIVSLISEIIRSEYKDDLTIAEADIDIANLLYFPTGGGKTEAFLGATVFAMFFDRLRGKNYGITAFLKYPLRLLAVQQLDRVLAIVMKANAVRENTAELAACTPFEVGFFVGKNNTPNKISPMEVLSSRGDKNQNKGLILESDQDTLNEYYRFIDTCPCCGKKQVNVQFNRETWKLEHVCDNPECQINALPLLIVDNEIYRYLPSVVVSTIDKMAMLGTSNDFRTLFGQVRMKCPIHGFTSGSKCLCPACTHYQDLVPVRPLKDPIPTLFIQDEMHLVKESLGTFDAHYESFISYYARELVPESQRKQIRFVGATATISMYKEHIRNLYHMEARRFPCEYPSVRSGEDFYSYTDNNDITRILLGYAPYGRSITDGMWESVYIMRLITYQLMNSPEKNYRKLVEKGFTGSLEEYKEMLFDYWIELVYNNRKQDAMELENAFQNQGNNYLEAKGVPKFNIEQMTSDTDFQTVRKALFDIQANRKNVDSTNLLLATSTISHGVDEDSFNLMFFFGIPNNNAEYIQAYSRTGRKFTGIVIDIIRLMRIRDRSYLKNFVVFHQNKDDLVESVPINRWAKNAIYSTLPGILAGILMQYYTVETGTDDFYHAVTVKRLLMDGQIKPDDVIEKLIAIYGCNEQEKMSIAYKEIIQEEVTHILSGIQNGNFTKSDYLSKAIGKFSRNHKEPMTSLRDTEEEIELKI